MAMDDAKRPARSGSNSQSSRCGPAEVNIFFRMQTDTAKGFTKVASALWVAKLFLGKEARIGASESCVQANKLTDIMSLSDHIVVLVYCVCQLSMLSVVLLLTMILGVGEIWARAAGSFEDFGQGSVVNLDVGRAIMEPSSLYISHKCVQDSTRTFLFKALVVFALREINLTKIESRPHKERPLRVSDGCLLKNWDYLFYADLEASMADPKTQNALGNLKEFATFLRVLGSYPTDVNEP